MNIKKITGSIGVIALVGTVVAAGTGAFFTDTEVSQGNIFTAGAINIEISNITHTGVNVSNEEVGFSVNNDAMSFSFADLKPLDHGKVSFGIQLLSVSWLKKLETLKTEETKLKKLRVTQLLEIPEMEMEN